MKSPLLSRMLRVLIVAALITLSLPRPALAQTSGLTYAVKSGDTLSFIAASFHTTVTRLLLVNSVPDPNNVQPGTVLVIPGFEDVQGEAIAVTLPAFESLDTFNRRTRVPEQLMNRLDFITNPDALYAGQPYYVIYKEELPQVEIPITSGIADFEFAVRQALRTVRIEENLRIQYGGRADAIQGRICARRSELAHAGGGFATRRGDFAQATTARSAGVLSDGLTPPPQGVVGRRGSCKNAVSRDCLLGPP